MLDYFWDGRVWEFEGLVERGSLGVDVGAWMSSLFDRLIV